MLTSMSGNDKFFDRPVSSGSIQIGLTMIKCVFFDFDDVLRNWDPSMHGIEGKFGIPLKVVRKVAFGKENLDPALRGEITDPLWRANVAQILADHYPDKDAHGAVKHWERSIGELNPEVLAIIKECKSVVKVALFSNATTRLNQDLESLGISDLFDYVVNASESGFFKPEPEIYAYALKLAGVESNEAFFTDDKPNLLNPALKLGWSGHLFEGATGLRSALVDAGVL
jgi:putative hydrolase of the HAD superfamily